MYVGIDQYNHTYWIKKHPRKELLEQLYATKAHKMYIDTASGTKHIGYVIKNHWITVYKLHVFNKGDKLC